MMSSEKRRASWRHFNNQPHVRERKVKAQREKYQSDLQFAESMKANSARQRAKPGQKEKNATWQREYRKKNPEHITALGVARRKRNPARYLLQRIRQRARSKKIECLISIDDLLPLPTVCPVFGVELEYHGRGHAKAHSASVDRIDNNKGYVPGNIVIVSHKANTMKNSGTIDELEKLANFYRELNGKWL